jgi:hypothetical protein
LLSDYPEENLCEGEDRYILPKFGRNKKKTFQIVNPLLTPDKIHLVRVTICSNPGEQCGSGAVFSHFNTSCVQKYSDHKMIVSNITGEFIETFSFPSCCVCIVKRNSLFEI